MRCGFEPAIDPDDAQSFWCHEALDRKIAAPAKCPAYTAALPVVIQVQHLLPHYRRGVLADRLRGPVPDMVYTAAAELDTSTEAARRYAEVRAQIEREARTIGLGARR